MVTTDNRLKFRLIFLGAMNSVSVSITGSRMTKTLAGKGMDIKWKSAQVAAFKFKTWTVLLSGIVWNKKNEYKKETQENDWHNLYNGFTHCGLKQNVCFEKNIFNRIIFMTQIRGAFKEICFWYAPHSRYVKSVLVQVMAWCCQAPSYYLILWWSRSIMPYGISS